MSTATKARSEEIKARYEAGGVSQAQLAEHYGISQTQVSRIIRSRKYTCKPRMMDNGHGLIGYSMMKLVRETLTRCERCGIDGPTARYQDHLREDHGLV